MTIHSSPISGKKMAQVLSAPFRFFMSLNRPITADLMPSDYRYLVAILPTLIARQARRENWDNCGISQKRNGEHPWARSASLASRTATP
jgi:hypothetical protein